MQNYTLRPARSSDQAQMMSLAHKGLRPHAEAVRTWDQTVEERGFAEHFTPESIQIIQVGGTDIGYIKVVKNEDYDFLEDIYLEREYRSRGIGESIIVDLLRASQKPIRLRVYRSNPAQNLYRRLGFDVLHSSETSLTMEHPNDANRVAAEDK